MRRICLWDLTVTVDECLWDLTITVDEKKMFMRSHHNSRWEEYVYEILQ